MTLEELTAEACKRVLASEELHQLCDLALKEGVSDSIVVQLMTARTASARLNLLAAKSLTERHVSVRKSIPMSESRRTLRHSRQYDASTDRTQPQPSSLPFSVTSHAFERFADRHLADRSDALTFLREEASSSSPLKEKTLKGDQVWVGRSGIRFVIKRDGNHQRPVCVTVLPRRSSEEFL